jgi:hypothetical protein
LDLRTIDIGSISHRAGGPYLVLDPDLRIVEASAEYVRATLLWNEEIVGRNMFEVFPDNPHNASATGVRNLNASLQDVLRSGKPQCMPEQRYDVRDRVTGGAWVEKYWIFLNTPVRSGGNHKITHVVHRVRDVTETVRLRKWVSKRMQVLEEQRATLEQMAKDLELECNVLVAAHQVLARDNPSIPDSLVVEELRCTLGAPKACPYLLPGEIAEVSGVYGVFHIRGCELAPDKVYRQAGSEFPQRPHCKDGTYYRLLRSM